ncbi:hypothetical protein TSMEX_010451 [Taenia solium]|eukprot:TsM_000436400 transcript=TsM_000436400 gene=TsM_000436400
MRPFLTELFVRLEWGIVFSTVEILAMSPRGCLPLLLILTMILSLSIQWTEAHGSRWDHGKEEISDDEELGDDDGEEDDEDEEEEEEKGDEKGNKEEKEKEEEKKEGEEKETKKEEEEGERKKDFVDGETKLLKLCHRLRDAVKAKMETLVDHLEDCGKMPPLV